MDSLKNPRKDSNHKIVLPPMSTQMKLITWKLLFRTKHAFSNLSRVFSFYEWNMNFSTFT